MALHTLVIDTATAACSVALFDGERLVAARHEVVGRGHAERVVPMVAELPGGGRADHVLVDVGPGSFTGIRVGIAAARGLALGWGASVSGYGALSLIAAAALTDTPVSDLAVVTEGGHGEVFMARFAHPFAALDDPRSLTPAAALAELGGHRAIGSGTRRLQEIDPAFPVVEALPDASRALLLPAAMRALPAAPFYGRAPDAKLPAARVMATMQMVELVAAGAQDADLVDHIMAAAFDPRYGEAWTRSQCIGILAMPGVWLTIARVDGKGVGFALSRAIMDEAELLLIAVAPMARGRGVGAALLRSVIAESQGRGVTRLHLEVRANNPAIALYVGHRFARAGVRKAYYRNRDGETFDAHTYARDI